MPYSAHDAYEVDHLIPLELGGSNSIRNLWPQPEGGSHLGYPAKDQLENRLHHLLCDGDLALAIAQHAIASNWWAAYKTYIGTPGPAQPSSPGPPPPHHQAQHCTRPASPKPVGQVAAGAQGSGMVGAQLRRAAQGLVEQRPGGIELASIHERGVDGEGG